MDRHETKLLNYIFQNLCLFYIVPKRPEKEKSRMVLSMHHEYARRVGSRSYILYVDSRN